MIVVLSNCIYTRDTLMPSLTQLYKVTSSPKITHLYEVTTRFCLLSYVRTCFRQKCVERFQDLDQRTFASYVSQTGAVFAEIVRPFLRSVSSCRHRS